MPEELQLVDMPADPIPHKTLLMNVSVSNLQEQNCKRLLNESFQT